MSIRELLRHDPSCDGSSKVSEDTAAHNLRYGRASSINGQVSNIGLPGLSPEMVGKDFFSILKLKNDAAPFTCQDNVSPWAEPPHIADWTQAPKMAVT